MGREGEFWGGLPAFQSVGADDSVRPEYDVKTVGRCTPRVHAAAVCAYVMGYRPLALSLGELSPQVTERALQPFLNNKIKWSWFTLSVLAALGHLSQRERQGTLTRYIRRRVGAGLCPAQKNM